MDAHMRVCVHNCTRTHTVTHIHTHAHIGQSESLSHSLM